MAGTTITIVLELDATEDSPMGTARLPDGTSRAFHGWLGLAEAIDIAAALHRGSAASARVASSPSSDLADTHRTEGSQS